MNIQAAFKELDNDQILFCEATNRYYRRHTFAIFIVGRKSTKLLSLKGAFTRKEIESNWRIADE